MRFEGAEHILKRLFAQSKEGLAILSSGLEFLEVNSVFLEIGGYQEQDIIGRTVLDFTSPDERAEIEIELEKLLAQTGDVSACRKQFLHRSGAWISCSWTVGVTDSAHEQAVYLIAQIQDLSKAEKLREQSVYQERRMQEAQKFESLGLLAGGIAHDFNNLLVSILGNADLALSELPAEASSRQYLAGVVRSSRRAAELCNQLLAYAGKGKFHVQPVGLNNLVVEMSHLLEIGIPKSTSLKYSCDRALPAVEADMTQVRQVVMNLITNAAEAIGDKPGTITISTSSCECDREFLRTHSPGMELEPGLYVVLEVADTGCGMSEQTKDSIFDPFFTTKFTGSGLGLAAVLGIVKNHRGLLIVETELGKGTTFRIMLPALPNSVSAIESSDTIKNPLHGSGRILIVDDDAGVRTVLEKILSKSGYKVHTACDGLSGLACFRENCEALDLVIVDMTMPDLSGDQVFREMKKIDSRVPVLISSGYTAQEVMVDLTGEGAAGFVQKPYTANTLLASVTNILTRT